ncbi:MAG: cupin domain-containing protein [bacterium]|nr:cupin domain-containing protein [bacterium]
MAIKHAEPGEVVDVSPLGDGLEGAKTHTLAQTDYAEIIRLVLPAGKDIATHSAPGQIIVQCIEGRVEFTAMGTGHVLEPAQLLFLPPSEPHSVKALESSSVLLTILKRSE